MKLINFRAAADLIVTYLESPPAKRMQMFTREFRDALLVVSRVADEIDEEDILSRIDEEPCEKELESPWEAIAPVKSCSMCGLQLSFREERDELGF